MPIDRLTLETKLKQLEEYLVSVKKLRRFPQSQFQPHSDPEILAERHIQKACQAALDIANHIIAEGNLGTPTMYRELGFILAKEKVITLEMAKKLESVAKFRNLLVHEYGEIDPKTIYKIIHQDIDDLSVFAQQIYAYLKRTAGVIQSSTE